MGLIKITDRDVWGCSRGLLHVVLDYVAGRADGTPFARDLKASVEFNDSSFYFDEIDNVQKQIFLDGVSSLIKNWWTFRDKKDEYDKSAFESLNDLRERLRSSIENGDV